MCFLKGLLLGTHPVFKQTLEFEKKTILYTYLGHSFFNTSIYISVKLENFRGCYYFSLTNHIWFFDLETKVKKSLLFLNRPKEAALLLHDKSRSQDDCESCEQLPVLLVNFAEFYQLVIWLIFLGIFIIHFVKQNALLDSNVIC